MAVQLLGADPIALVLPLDLQQGIIQSKIYTTSGAESSFLCF